MIDIKAISYEQTRTDFLKAELQKAQNRIKFWQMKIKNAKSATQEMEAHENASDAGWEYNFYKDALEALDAMPKWISVKDRLPEPETEVLVWLKHIPNIAIYGHDKYGNLDFYFIDECGYRCTFRPAVTHWMPLPEPPKEDA